MRKRSPASVQWIFLLPFTGRRAPSLRRMQTSPTFLTPTAGPRQTEKRARNTRGDPAKRKDFPMQILFRFLPCLSQATLIPPPPTLIRPSSQPFLFAFPPSPPFFSTCLLSFSRTSVFTIPRDPLRIVGQSDDAIIADSFSRRQSLAMYRVSPW